jgi:hypothetical protein
MMPKTIEGVYRRGQVEFVEELDGVEEGTKVLVTILAAGTIDLRQRGIDEVQAAALRGRLARFSEEWDSDEMSIYDDYESRALRTR